MRLIHFNEVKFFGAHGDGPIMVNPSQILWVRRSNLTNAETWPTLVQLKDEFFVVKEDLGTVTNWVNNCME